MTEYVEVARVTAETAWLDRERFIVRCTEDGCAFNVPPRYKGTRLQCERAADRHVNRGHEVVIEERKA